MIGSGIQNVGGEDQGDGGSAVGVVVNSNDTSGRDGEDLWRMNEWVVEWRVSLAQEQKFGFFLSLWIQGQVRIRRGEERALASESESVGEDKL